MLSPERDAVPGAGSVLGAGGCPQRRSCLRRRGLPLAQGLPFGVGGLTPGAGSVLGAGAALSVGGCPRHRHCPRHGSLSPVQGLPSAREAVPDAGACPRRRVCPRRRQCCVHPLWGCGEVRKGLEGRGRKTAARFMLGPTMDLRLIASKRLSFPRRGAAATVRLRGFRLARPVPIRRRRCA
jgi:hypothetical protein